MSQSISNIINLPEAALKFLVQNEIIEGESVQGRFPPSKCTQCSRKINYRIYNPWWDILQG